METQEILRTITAAKDSVWVINQAIEKLNAGEEPSTQTKSLISRNVEHLKLVVGKDDIKNSGEDLSDLMLGISAGEAKLAEVVWPEEEKIPLRQRNPA